MCRRPALATLVAAIAVAGASPAADAAPAFRLVVHPANPTGALDAAAVSDLLLKRNATWPDGEVVEPVDQKIGAPVRQAFSAVVHGRAPSAISSYWQRQIFSGAAVPPPELADDAAVLAFVRDHRGGVGYVSAAAPLDGVRAVDVAAEPRPTTRVDPEYPYPARRARVEGRVVLDVEVDAAGKVTDVVAVEELPLGLTDAAITAVRRWRFEPATLNGEPVAGKLQVQLNFAL